MSPKTRGRRGGKSAASPPSTPAAAGSPSSSPDTAARSHSPRRRASREGVGDAWQAAAHVDGELRVLGRFASEADAHRAHDAATATQSALGSPGLSRDKRPAKTTPARRTSFSTRPAVRAPAPPALSPSPPPRPPRPPPPRRRFAVLPLLLLLAAAAALAWHLRAAARERAARAAAAHAAPRCAASASQLSLEALVPPSLVWRDWAASLAEELAAPRGASALAHQKANVVLLVAPTSRVNATSAAGARALEGALDAALPRCASSRCRLSLRGGDFGAFADGAEARGALQAALVPFLTRCPGGLVLLHDVHALPGAALPALLPLLSEAGQYTHGGAAVPAWRAAAVLTARLAGYEPAWEAKGEEALARGAKAALAAAMQAAAGGDEAAHHVARALRRRVDAVAPLRRALRHDGTGGDDEEEQQTL